MNKSSLVIIGASGHGRVVADIATLTGYKQIFFLDDSQDLLPKVNGKVSDFDKYLGIADFIVAIGNNRIREDIFKKLQKRDANIVSLIHPNSTVSESVSVGKGTVIMAGSVVNSGAVLGKGVIVNTSSSVDHDCIIGDFSHVSVGAHLAGTVTVGKQSFICAGSTIINNISVCDNCVIGAGAVVIGNIETPGTYVGVPAKKLNR